MLFYIIIFILLYGNNIILFKMFILFCFYLSI